MDCSIDGCNSKVIARGWCHKHYKRWQTTGTTELSRLSDYERFTSHVDKVPGGCHLWAASTNPISGYGQFKAGGTMIGAHRWLLGYARGKPLTRDEYALHRCDVRACVNLDHLYIGDQQQNMRDAAERNRMRPWNRFKTHCRNGHPLSGENVRVKNTMRGTERVCRTCARERRRRERQQMAANTG